MGQSDSVIRRYEQTSAVGPAVMDRFAHRGQNGLVHTAIRPRIFEHTSDPAHSPSILCSDGRLVRPAQQGYGLTRPVTPRPVRTDPTSFSSLSVVPF